MDCTFCKKSITGNEFIAVIGELADDLKWGLRQGFRVSALPMFNTHKIYCKSCFNKKFKENKK